MNINNIFNVCKITSKPKVKKTKKSLSVFFEADIETKLGDCRIKLVAYSTTAKRCSYLWKGDVVYLTGYLRNVKKDSGNYSHKNFIEVSSVERIYKDTSNLKDVLLSKNIVGNINQALVCGVICTDVRMSGDSENNKCFFKIVINELYNENLEEVKVFANIAFEDAVARNASTWLSKGDHVYVTGHLKNYKDQAGRDNNTYILGRYFKRIYSQNLYKIHKEKKVILTSDLGEIVD